MCCMHAPYFYNELSGEWLAEVQPGDGISINQDRTPLAHYDATKTIAGAVAYNRQAARQSPDSFPAARQGAVELNDFGISPLEVTRVVTVRPSTSTIYRDSAHEKGKQRRERYRVSISTRWHSKSIRIGNTPLCSD